MDILKANLDAGISVQKYVPSYGDAPNDIMHVTKCERCFQGAVGFNISLIRSADFKEKFRAYQVREVDEFVS